MNAGQKWYAVYTRPKWEKKVAELLTKKGIQNYCPVNKVVRQWSDRKKTVIEPLFTSYVFVRTADTEHVKLKQTPGVINLVYWLSKPAVIRDVEIEMIQRFLNEHTNVQLERTPVNINDIVRVTSGPLMEQQGVVKAVNSKTVKVILPSLGFMMSAEVEVAHIEVVSQHLREHATQTTGRFALG